MSQDALRRIGWLAVAIVAGVALAAAATKPWPGLEPTAFEATAGAGLLALWLNPWRRPTGRILLPAAALALLAGGLATQAVTRAGLAAPDWSAPIVLGFGAAIGAAYLGARLAPPSPLASSTGAALHFLAAQHIARLQYPSDPPMLTEHGVALAVLAGVWLFLPWAARRFLRRRCEAA